MEVKTMIDPITKDIYLRKIDVIEFLRECQDNYNKKDHLVQFNLLGSLIKKMKGNQND